MKMDFKNPREVFLQNGMKNKNLSQFFHRCYEQGESKPSSRPFFPDFHFSVTVLILQELLRPAGGRIWKNRRRFLSRTCPYTIKSFIFFPGVIVEEKTRLFGPLFRRKPVRLSWQTVPNFVGLVAIFGRGGYNRLSKLVGGSPLFIQR
jgi:hypothetical protein